MIDKYYNPYDIYKNEDAKQHLQETIKKLTPKTFSVSDQIASSAFSYLTGVTNFLGVGFAYLFEIGTNYNIKQLQREQLAHLEKHPEDLKQELHINLIVSLLYLKEMFEIKEKMNFVGFGAKTIWRMIKNLSVQEGLAETMVESMNKHSCEKWIVLRSSISLLLNAFYVNKNVSLIQVDSYLSDLIRAGEKTSDIDSLCTYKFENALFNGTIRKYLESQFEMIIQHAKKYQEEIPQLTELLDKCISLKDLQVQELQDQDKRAYEFYRNEIEQWAKDYPAHKNSNNYEMVIDALSSCAKVQKDKLDLNTRLMEDLNLGTNERSNLCKIFERKKNFLIDNIYMDKFMTISEIVSFWNAFDNSDPLDMEDIG